MATYFWREGLGEAIQFVNGHDALGGERDSDGYLLQGTYKFGELQLGLSYGQSSLDGTGCDQGVGPAACAGGCGNLVKDTETWVIQGKYDLMPGLSLIAEYADSQQDAQAPTCTPAGGGLAVSCEQKAKTFSIGAIVFF